MVGLDRSLVNHTVTDSSLPLLHMAVWYNQPEVVKYLVSQVRDVTYTKLDQ